MVMNDRFAWFGAAFAVVFVLTLWWQQPTKAQSDYHLVHLRNHACVIITSGGGVAVLRDADCHVEGVGN